MEFFELITILVMVSGADCIPAINSITPGGVIVSGGIGVTVNGTGLTDNSQPKVVITGTYMPDNTTSVTDSFTGLACTVITATSLACPSPRLTLTKFTDAGYVIPTGSKIRMPNDTQISFKIGVTFTGFTNSISHQSVDIYKDPVVTMENPKRTYTVWTNRIVNIYGSDLDKFVRDKSEYDISISNLKCPPMYLNSTFMWCLLPTSTPIPNDPDKLHSIVQLKVGDYTQQIGRLWYRIPIFQNNTAGDPQIFIPNDPTDTISIHGTNFMVAITSGSVYRIQIGQGECTNIQLSPTEIKCRPPDLEPQPLSYRKRGNLSQIVITVPKITSTAAHRHTEHVGYVQYSDQIITTTTTPSPGGNNNNNNLQGSDAWNTIWKWVLLGLAFFSGLIFLICLCCCFCCCKDIRRNRRGYQRKKESEQSYTERNGSTHSSFKSYQSKTASTYLDSDGSRFYYVTDERMPASRYYGNITKMRY